jgi:stage II sporulation protein D
MGDQVLDPTRTYSVRAEGARAILRSPDGEDAVAFEGPVRAAGPGPLRVAGRSALGVRDGAFRGELEFRPSGGKLLVINAVGLDDYVRGVVAGESPPTWPAEALKAQAVAARTYAITSNAGGTQGFTQWSDTRSQVYRGVAGETPTTDAAVAATSREIVTYLGRPVTTFFFSTSGGRTENVENSFLGATPQPWLKSVEDPYDNASPRHRWGPMRFTRKQAQARLRGYVKGTLRTIKVTRRGVSPRIVSAQVVGSEGTTTISGPTLRTRFGLFDTWATFTRIGTTVKPPAPAPPAAAPPAPLPLPRRPPSRSPPSRPAAGSPSGPPATAPGGPPASAPRPASCPGRSTARRPASGSASCAARSAAPGGRASRSRPARAAGSPPRCPGRGPTRCAGTASTGRLSARDSAATGDDAGPLIAHAPPYTRTSDSATQTGLSPPSTSKVCVIVSCRPPETSSTAVRVARMRSLESTGTGAGKRTLP